MPYIKQHAREYVEDNNEPETAGELNYIITRMLLTYLGPNPTYFNFNEVIGVLECCKLELYRRTIAPYEDAKCDENGDVYP